MPRIDPNQLLTCLNPLLAINGGIKSSGEVIRLANLMEKYSKKLVSKCIYIQILKCTETDLLGQFMAAGGWNLVHNWLRDGCDSSNWAFVQELLEMLLLCPVDGNRLKSNHTPKIVKNLSVSCPHHAVRILSTKLVEQWLKIAHQEKQQFTAVPTNGLNGTTEAVKPVEEKIIKEEPKITNGKDETDSKSDEENTIKSSENIKYKVSNKESSGKLLLSLKRSTSPNPEEKEPKLSRTSSIESKSSSHESKSSSHESKSRDKEKDKEKKSSSSKSSSSSRSSSSKSSHRDKDKDRSSKSSSSSSSSHHKSSSSKSSKSSSSSRDKDRDRKRDSDKDKEKDKEKSQAEKDKETLNFLTPMSSSKLQRIPKRQHSENSENKSAESNDASPNKIAKPTENVEKKKPSISIEVRKGDKPKTVKTLNSQFRNHGLAEEPPKPPSRKDLKKPSTTPVVPPVVKPASTASAASPPPSKKINLDVENVPERVGGVKLIKPKPILVESISFMDALTSSAVSNKKDPKKRKRLTSNSSSSKKDEPESPKIEAKPLKFYKDTLEEAEEEQTNGEKSPTKEVDKESSPRESKTESPEPKDASPEKSPAQETDEPEEKRPPGVGCGPDGPPGVLVGPNAARRKKRPIRWRPDEELTDIRYFELDETERTNVSKTFIEQKAMEHVEERSAFILGRKMQNEDTMAEQTKWRALIIVDNVPSINYGSKSREITIQAERELNVLQDIYFRPSLKDSPGEPDHENYEHVEPQIIPLDDVTGNPDSVTNFTDIQWPAPKGELPVTFTSNAFANVFSAGINIPSGITIPPSVAINNNPLASFGMAGLPVREPPINQWMIQPTPFLQPPPIMMPQQPVPGFVNRGNLNNFRTSNNNTNNNNNHRPMNGIGGGAGNWIRGNARRGVCNQFQRSGFCRNKNCPYLHER